MTAPSFDATLRSGSWLQARSHGPFSRAAHRAWGNAQVCCLTANSFIQGADEVEATLTYRERQVSTGMLATQGYGPLLVYSRLGILLYMSSEMWPPLCPGHSGFSPKASLLLLFCIPPFLLHLYIPIYYLPTSLPLYSPICLPSSLPLPFPSLLFDYMCGQLQDDLWEDLFSFHRVSSQD